MDRYQACVAEGPSDQPQRHEVPESPMLKSVEHAVTTPTTVDTSIVPESPMLKSVEHFTIAATAFCDACNSPQNL
jgi:hypothetical protein